MQNHCLQFHSVFGSADSCSVHSQKCQCFFSPLVEEEKIGIPTLCLGTSPILLKSKLHLGRLPVLVARHQVDLLENVFSVYLKGLYNSLSFYQLFCFLFVCFCFSCKVAACFDPYVLQLVTDFVISLHSFLFSHFLFSPFKHGLLILHEIWSVGGHNWSC